MVENGVGAPKKWPLDDTRGDAWLAFAFAFAFAGDALCFRAQFRAYGAASSVT